MLFTFHCNAQCLGNLTPRVSGHAQKSSGIETAFIGFFAADNATGLKVSGVKNVIGQFFLVAEEDFR